MANTGHFCFLLPPETRGGSSAANFALAWAKYVGSNPSLKNLDANWSYRCVSGDCDRLRPSHIEEFLVRYPGVLAFVIDSDYGDGWEKIADPPVMVDVHECH